MAKALLAGALLVIGSRANAAPVVPQDDADRDVIGSFLGHVESSAAYCTPERMAKFAAQPEDITWQASLYIKMALLAYELTEDTKYLDMFVERMDALCSCLETGPDGYRGWYGVALELFRHPEHPDREIDVIITSFVVSGMAADFACVVRTDDALRTRYGGPAKRYLALAEEHLVKKWDARGCYRELGDGRAVYTTHPDLKPVKGSLTQPHNKHSKIIRALLSMYKATGKDEYAVKAVRLGARFMSCLTKVEDRYDWHYWDPSGAWDIHPEDPGKWKHWIGAEHRNGYYSLSLSQAVLLYEHGLLFTRADIDRFVRTQMDVCWNGDAGDPVWKQVDGKPTEKSYLCSSLAPFEERVYEMACGAPAQAARLERPEHPWQGGPVAMGYLELKYLTYPKWGSGEPAEADAMAPFLAKPENRRLVDDLAARFGVGDYAAPESPADMDPMPGK